MKIKLPSVRLSFPGLFKAEPFQPGDEPKFKATFLVPKGSETDKAVQKAILEAATAKWGVKSAAKILDGIRGNSNRFAYQDGDTKTYDGYEGMMALTAKNSTRPLVIDRDKSPLTESDGKPYAGCYVNGTVDVFCYDKPGNGVSFSLSGVQYVRQGDAFGGGRPASPDDFDDLGDGADAEDNLLGD